MISTVFLDNDGRLGMSRKYLDNDRPTRPIGSHLFLQSTAVTSETLCVNEALDVDVTIFHLLSWQCQGHSWRRGRMQHPLLTRPLLENMFRAQVCQCLMTAGE